MQYKTPDVYVQEKSTLPPSVAEVATAIPVFVGYTDKIENVKGEALTQKPTRIGSMNEFYTMFGGAYEESFYVNAAMAVKNDTKGDISQLPEYILTQSVQHFFTNGGGACYILSVGKHGDTKAEQDFLTALDKIKLVDEITLICMPDAISLGPAAYYNSLCTQAIAQCSKLQDRFALIDVITTGDERADVELMRNSVSGDLKYGASYYPYLTTTMARSFDEEKVIVEVEVEKKDAEGNVLTEFKDCFLSDLNDPASDDTNTAVYNAVKSQLTKNYLVLPPTAAVAGIYAKTDADRGVWKAPANVAVAGVLGPVVTIDNDEQESMNVDAVSGKSVNAIRSFTGKGTLVWGARTLAGNDNEWRYVSVRRLFNMVEESIQKATHFAVFEPNTPFTWLKLKTMMESYLENLWKQGAFFGASPEQAFFVNVGLGQTMTEDDINNGIMNIEIGLAAVRPAEFIVLTFSHKRLEG